MPDDSDLALAGDFPPATAEQWRSLVSAVLAKSGVTEDSEEALTSTTYDGIRIAPLYSAQDAPAAWPAPGVAPFVRGAGGTGWDVRTRHAGPSATQANQAGLQDLERGATSLWLVLRTGGLRPADLAAVLDGVYLDLAPIVLDAGADGAAAGAALLALADERGVARADVRGSLGVDPIGTCARSGIEPDLSVLGHVAALLGTAEQSLAATEQSKSFDRLFTSTVDATIYHDAGASDAQEVGIATAVGVAYLRALTDAGLSIDAALAALEFRFAVTAEQFPSIAKLRAARLVWDRVAQLSGASEQRQAQAQHAVTSAAMLTRRDPWVNMLRTTIGCFAAAVGGAQAITVSPFDAAIGVSDDFARRVARNTQAVLHDESSLARVADAAGGSWFVESLTDALADEAWTVFTDIEKNGGAVARLTDGTIGRFLAGMRERRADDVAHRRAPITGVSEFAFVDEPPVTRAPLDDLSDDEAILPTVRYAAEFEQLRDRSDAAASRPSVYLATLGPVAAHSARAAFAATLFAAGGIECTTGPVEQFRGGVACLCSSDKLYADEAPDAVARLRAAGATLVWLAGRHDSDGVDGYLYTGCDALDVLRTTLTALEVA